MRWIWHLIGAALAGIFVIIVWEQVSGVSISRKAVEVFSWFDIGPGLMIAILVIGAVLIWAKSSSG